MTGLLRQAATRLRVAPDQVAELAPQLDIERFAPGEVMDVIDRVPDKVRWIAQGRAGVVVGYDKGGGITALTLARGDLTGLTALTRQPSSYSCVALTEVTVLAVPAEVLDGLARRDVRLARDIGREIDQRAAGVGAALRDTDRSITAGP